jgi:glycosyltransferase involved in cell wall biosynthesis
MNDLTALILTYNEQENISRTLDSISWVQKILIVDSYSTDETVKLAGSYPNVSVVQRAFDSFAGQCQFGLSQIETNWVLSLDADYAVASALAEEIRSLPEEAEVAGYSVVFRYCIFGRPLRTTLYPPRTVLYRRELATYHDEGHGHKVIIRGKILPLKSFINHDDRKPLSRWIQSQDRYALIEAQHLLSTPVEQLSAQDRLRRKIFFAAPAMFLYLLFARGLILDGWPGWFYVYQRTIAELLLSNRLLIEREKLEDRRWKGNEANVQHPTFNEEERAANQRSASGASPTARSEDSDRRSTDN